MNKQTRTSGSKAIERRLAERRGEGRGRDFKPWLTIHDVPSQGLAKRMKSPLNGHVYAVQASSDLKNWTCISTNSPANGAYSFTVSASHNSSPQFYRSVLLK